MAEEGPVPDRLLRACSCGRDAAGPWVCGTDAAVLAAEKNLLVMGLPINQGWFVPVAVVLSWL